jgi:hypothetical protein
VRGLHAAGNRPNRDTLDNSIAAALLLREECLNVCGQSSMSSKITRWWLFWCFMICKMNGDEDYVVNSIHMYALAVVFGASDP